MFEQTFVHSGGAARKPWSMAVSLTGQLMLTAVVVLLPLLKTAEIMWKPPVVVFTLPHAAKPVPVEIQPAGSKAIIKMRPIFDARLAAPTHIPEKIKMIVDEVSVPALATGLIQGGPGDTVLLLGESVGKKAAQAPPSVVKPIQKPNQEAVHVGGKVQQAMLLHQKMPVYPQLARAARVSGTVVLAAVIAKDGSVQKLQLISGPPLLVEAALSAVRQWIYKPTLLNGEPVEVITEITVNFTLSN
jgi:periplasmic protein TonB